MFSIFKQNNKPEVPAWASFFNRNEYDSFLKAIEHYFKQGNFIYELDNGTLRIKVDDFGSNELGLLNLAQVYKQSGTGKYKEIVSEHFNCLLRAKEFDVEFKKIINDYEKVRPYIGVRLYPIDYVAHIGKELTIGKNFAGDIYAMLIFDLPDSIINIQPGTAEKWGIPVDELFHVGIQNVKDKYPLEISQQSFDEFKIWFIQSNHFFTPNVVFDLGNQKKLIGSNGSLIGIPHRHSVIIYPIENIEIVKAINALIPTIYGMNVEGPGSVSNNLFWYNDGCFTELPYKIEDDKLQFFPPDKFLEMLNNLK